MIHNQQRGRMNQPTNILCVISIGDFKIQESRLIIFT